jgi:phosphatidylserine/phosphatidylglycerophosphate/cardiolipin synthase-like enzyme
MTAPRTGFRFPWRDGNRFVLHVDGGRFYPAMLAAIDGAQRFVALEMYLFESGHVADRFIRALIAAARRGVAVHVLLDHYGSLALRESDRAQLIAGGVRLAYYNPLQFALWRRVFYRDHRKLLIADGVVSFVGGAGVADEFDPAAAPSERHWRETMIEIRGAVVRDWSELFCEVWQRSAGVVLSVAPVQDAAGAQRGRVVSNHARGSWEVNRSLLKRIRAAEFRVWLATAYFVPSWKLRRALRGAARDGADVRLLLPGRYSDHPGVRHAGRRRYGGLLRHGVRVFEYQPRFMHQKVFLCDDWVSIGSSNVDRWGQRWNLEANQEVEDAELAHLTRDMLRADFNAAVEITYDGWRKRSWHRRTLEWFWGRVDRLLERMER